MKKAIIGLWISSFALVLVGIIVAQFRPFSSEESAMAYFVGSSLILTAMLLQTLKSKDVTRDSLGAVIDENSKALVKKNMFIMKVVFIAIMSIDNVYRLILRLM